MSNVTPFTPPVLGGHYVPKIDMPDQEVEERLPSGQLARSAYEDLDIAFDLYAPIEPNPEDMALAYDYLIRAMGSLRILRDRFNPAPSGLGAVVPRLAIEAGARLHGATPSTVAAGWPSCVQLRDLPERVRWAQYSAARLNRELMEREGFQFAEAFEAFNARIIEELGLSAEVQP